jgi:hypothetical protein
MTHQKIEETLDELIEREALIFKVCASTKEQWMGGTVNRRI